MLTESSLGELSGRGSPREQRAQLQCTAAIVAVKVQLLTGIRMAFLTTFSAMLVAGGTWMALFITFYDSDDPRLQSLDGFLSPNAITGWVFFVALCVLFCWFLYRVFRIRLRRH